MLHRQIWETLYGPIPDGCEINHKCKNRECCNPKHLECLPTSEHRSKDNALRYKARELEILQYAKNHPHQTQAEIGKNFGVSKACVQQMLKRNNQPKPNSRYLKLNVQLGVDVKFGDAYSEIH
jgi:hypothetical protein